MANYDLERNSFLTSTIFYCILLLSFASATFLDDQTYCALRYRRLCQGKGHHVGCQYPYPGPGVGCQNYTQIKFTAKLRHFIINYINRRRQRIAAGTEKVRGGALIPKPQIMMMVVWDRELALLAQRLADQCSFIHDDCRATVRYPYSGQTVGEVRWRGSSSESDILSAQRAMRRVFDAWWGERRRVQPQQLIAPFKVGTKGSAWGHFSQLAVWTLAAAGCGAARHGSPRRLLLVCDFSHTNMLGQSTLTPGELAPCPTHYARRSRSAYPLLCAPTRIPDQNADEANTEYESYEDFLKLSNEDDDYDDTISTTSDINNHTNVHTTTCTKLIDHTKPNYPSKLKNVTNPHIVDKLDLALEVKSTSQRMTYRKKFTTRAYFGDIRENHEGEDELKGRFKIIIPAKNTEEMKIYTEMSRRRWKQTRYRPRRPGADALLSKPMKKNSQRPSVESLSLDKEGMEQLFKDTGFHKHWKTDSLP